MSPKDKFLLRLSQKSRKESIIARIILNANSLGDIEILKQYDLKKLKKIN